MDHHLDFRQWLESSSGVRDVILNYLRDALSIQDDGAILALNTADIAPNAISGLMERGAIPQADPGLLVRIRNGMTVGELIDAISMAD